MGFKNQCCRKAFCLMVSIDKSQYDATSLLLRINMLLPAGKTKRAKWPRMSSKTSHISCSLRPYVMLNVNVHRMFRVLGSLLAI